MKFLRVTFRCFGPFEERKLDLSGAGGLHVVFGPNEAGKSSALRGLYALLFGFPVQSADNFRFNYPQFRVEASLQNSAGETLDCVRRKGNKATLRMCDDKTEIPEATLAAFLGGLQQPQFEQLFGLDCQRLVDGGREIAAGEGDLGEALFAAGAGLAGLRKLSESLAARQAALFKPRSQSLPINAGLSRHSELLAAVRSNSLPPDKYADAVSAAYHAENTANRLREQRDEVRARLVHLERYQTALPTIDLLERAKHRLAPVADAPLLAADFEEKLNAACKERELARGELTVLTKSFDDLSKLHQAAQPPAAVLAEEDEIDELKRAVGVELKGREEQIKADTRRREEEEKARDIFRQLTGTVAWDQMPGLKPRLEDERRITELAADSKAVAQGVTVAETKVRAAREALAVAKNKQSQLDPPIAAAPWSSLVESIMARGPLEEQAHERQAKLAAEEQQLQAEFVRLQPSAPGDWSGAAAVPVPAIETVVEFRKRFEQSQQAVSRLQTERQQCDRDLLAHRGQVAAAAGAEPMPTLVDLTAARENRDGGLQLIRQRLAGEPLAAAEEKFTNQHAPGRPLIDAAEASVREADELADRLRREADRAAVWQTLQQNLKILQDRRDEIAEDLTAAESHWRNLEPEWQAIWEPAGIKPQSPEVMHGWLMRWHRLCEQVVLWHDRQRQHQEDQRQIATLQAQLAEACPAAAAAKTLAEACLLARQIAKESADKAIRAEKIQEEVARLQIELAAAEMDLSRAHERQSSWKEQWTSAIAVLRLQDSEISVATAQDYLRRIDEMQQHLREMRIKAARVKEIGEERVLLLARLTALRQRLDSAAKPSTAESLDADFRHVEATLKDARVRRTQHEEHAKQLKHVQNQIAAATDSHRSAEASLAALAVQLGVSDIDSIAAAVQRAKERAAAEKEVKSHETVLAQIARGQRFEEFIAAALQAREGLEQEIAALTSRAIALDPEISAAEAEVLTTAQVLKDYERASDAAATAKQQAESVAARLTEQVVEYAALQVASVALERAKERYRARNQESLLSRAGDFFRTLTGQAFRGLDIDNEEGDDVLKAVRDNGHPNQRVAVTGLSDGTRDQLFLALRLAGIEQHLQNREPVPLIIDDVLMTFDDSRSRATLKCLAELSTKTQVLLFTHHEHVLKLAKEVDPATIEHRL